jgi:subtilisin-like proprotein convertase family protein
MAASTSTRATAHAPRAPQLSRLLCILALVPGAVVAGAAPTACDQIIDLLGAGAGSIPDGAAGGTLCGDPGAPRDVTFAVNATPGLSVTDVTVRLGLTHSWIGDITARLVAPNGAFHTLFGRIGALSATACGDTSNASGTYEFNDLVVQPSGGIWQAAADVASDQIVPGVPYRTTDSGGDGAVNPMPPTNMTDSFASVDNASGTWTLRVTDGGSGDTGSVSFAQLSLCLTEITDVIFADGFEALPF